MFPKLESQDQSWHPAELSCKKSVYTNSDSVEVILLFSLEKKPKPSHNGWWLSLCILLIFQLLNAPGGIIVWTWPPLTNLYICHTQGSHPYQSLSYTSGDTAADSPAHVSRAGLQAKDSPRKESLLSNLTGSFRSLHNLLEGMPQRNEPSAATAAKSSSLTRTGTAPLLRGAAGKLLGFLDHKVKVTCA